MALPPPRLATCALHSDSQPHDINSTEPVAPSLEFSTTYRAIHPDSDLATHLEKEGYGSLDYQNPPAHIYSRYTSDTRGRAEAVLSGLMKANALTYSSGLTAAYAAVIHYCPSVIAIRKGYHGVHESFKLYNRTNPNLKIIDLDDEYPSIEPVKEGMQEVTRGRLLVWLETPLNPTGEARDIAHYAERAHKAGGSLAVDSTFGPPPLQDPFEFGADMVMHSATKYFGGHSDLLAGVLAVKSKKEWDQLWHDRTYLGSTPGNMEAWLLLRSLRSLSVRVLQQSKTATLIAEWLNSLTSSVSKASSDPLDEDLKDGKVVNRVWHASFQPRDPSDKDQSSKPREMDCSPTFDPRDQMKGGWPACFAFRLAKISWAKYLAHQTTYFTPATSLGGVESLLEWRCASDPGEDPYLLRISIGLEDLEDLKADIRNALRTVIKMDKDGKFKDDSSEAVYGL